MLIVEKILSLNALYAHYAFVCAFIIIKGICKYHIIKYLIINN